MIKAEALRTIILNEWIYLYFWVILFSFFQQCPIAHKLKFMRCIAVTTLQRIADTIK